MIISLLVLPLPIGELGHRNSRLTYTRTLQENAIANFMFCSLHIDIGQGGLVGIRNDTRTML